MTTAVIERTAQEEKQSGFISGIFNKITSPLRDWINDIKEQYEDAKIHVATGVMPNREFSKPELKEQHLKHIMRSVYTRDIVEDSPEGLRASIQQFHDENGGGFDVEEVAKYAESVPIADREKLTPAYLKNPQFTDELTA